MSWFFNYIKKNQKIKYKKKQENTKITQLNKQAINASLFNRPQNIVSLYVNVEWILVGITDASSLKNYTILINSDLTRIYFLIDTKH